MEGFTLGLAFVDCLPVVYFSISVCILSLRFHSLLFFVGAFLVIAAGALKCLWKFILAMRKKNIPFLFYQMRVVMPVGFVLILLSLFVDRKSLSLEAILAQITSFPSILFYLLGIAGMVCMTIFAKRLDSKNPRHNWIEQLTNAFAQLCFLIGILL